MLLYEFLDGRKGTITEWSLEKVEERKLNRVLDTLQGIDRDQAIDYLVFKVDVPKIYYAKVQGKVKLRPRACFGPLAGKDDREQRFTFLQAATERDWATVPPNANDRAAERRKKIIADPKKHWRTL